MDRSRSVDPESGTADPATAHVVPRPAVPGGEAAARLLGYQTAGGNQMAVRLLAAARQAAEAASQGSVAESIRDRSGGGSPLPADVRAEAEAGLGRPLDGVRLHTDAPAAALATQLNAHAFTTGNDIFFNSGVYDPGSRSGYEVLVHELAHTLQEPPGPVSGRLAAEGLSVSGLHDPDERAARAVAARLAARRDTQAQTGQAHVAGTPRSSAGEHGPLVVHRHSSWEHTLLGDTRPDKLGEALVQLKGSERTQPHLLKELHWQMSVMGRSPGDDPRRGFPDVRWFQLAKSGLWVSHGELNALPDYLPDLSTADTMSREQLIPIVQRMRAEALLALYKIEFPGMESVTLEDMATHGAEFLSAEGGQVWALDKATASQGYNRYQGLLAKNACHFAPFSWDRWEHFHNEAAEHARAHFASGSGSRPSKDTPAGTEEHARQALLKNSYADHFLQDSFAAGHLVNKTLIMQWWVDYLKQNNQQFQHHPRPGQPRPVAGQPAKDVLDRMGSRVQPGIAGRELYDHKPSKETSRDDRERGTGVTDPQTAQERADRQRRRSGSGVTGSGEAEIEANYQAYLQLLNNAQAQGATKAAHDHFNKIGLTVVNGNGTRMRVGGDDTLLKQSDRTGAELAAEAARLSRQAIDDLMTTGRTAITTEQIFAYVPVAVVPDGATEPVPLEQWHDTILHDLCFSTIFPGYHASATARVGNVWPEMVSGGISPDTPRAP